MKYTLKKIRIYAAFISIFFNVAHSMDIDVPSDDTKWELSKSAQVLWIMLNHQVNFDHDIICSLAINKEYEKVLQSTAKNRKSYMESYISKDFLQPSLVWHKYGSACGKKEVFKDEGYDWLAFRVFYLPEISLRSYRWQISSEDILKDEKSFFNEDGNICCYALEPKNHYNYFYLGKNQHVSQFCLPKKGEGYEEVLFVNINRKCSYAFSQFVSFPHLLKAMLQAKKMTAINFRGCDIDTVTIPDNYKTCILCDDYKTFDDLPVKLREAIEKRYWEQKK